MLKYSIAPGPNSPAFGTHFGNSSAAYPEHAADGMDPWFSDWGSNCYGACHGCQWVAPIVRSPAGLDVRPLAVGCQGTGRDAFDILRCLTLRRAAAPAAGATNQELLERLLKMEDRLNQVTKAERTALAGGPGAQTRESGPERGGRRPGRRDAARRGPGRRLRQTGRTVGHAPGDQRGRLGIRRRRPDEGRDAQLEGNRHRGRSAFLGGTYDFENDGFRWGTEDNEVTIGIRALQQIDARIYANSNQEFASSGVFNPRTRLYFEGNLTRPLSYEFSLQHTYLITNLLDSYVNYRFGDGFQLRFGRYKTPFDYEWYRVHIWHTLAPERSPFAQNFGGNRRFGFMGWGSLFDNRLEYAVGSFNGQRNGFTAFNSHQDIMAFLNFKPFEQKSDFFLRNLQVGGSLDAGIENSPLSPAVLTTSSPSTPVPLTPGSVSVPFLAFSDGVRERGYRALWELHVAYYYKGLSFLGAWDSGFQDYALGSSGPPPIRVPTGGYFAQVGYILTGETIRDRMLIEPLQSIRPPPRPLRPGCPRGHGPLQRPDSRPPGLHRRPGRPQPLDQSSPDG